jgi:hypothetical protein
MIAVVAGNPHSEVALTIAFIAFLVLLVEVFWIRRPADLERDLRLPLDDAPRAPSLAPRGETHVPR